jgi:O-glycosyl hydrolase
VRNHKRRKRAAWFESLESRLCLSVATVNFNDIRQTMDGFGAQPGYGDNPNPTDSALQLAFSQTSGIGLSYLRGSMSWNGYAQDQTMAKRAALYGTQQIMSPRGPAVAWLTDFDNSNHGYLDPSHYQDYASLLADYVQNAARQGIPVYAISLDVESDITTDITAQWTGEEFAALLPYVGSTFRARGITTKIIVNEDVGWTAADFNHIMADPDLSQYVDIIADHAYGQAYNPYTKFTNTQGRNVWMTEFFPDSSGTNIQNAISQAVDMYNAITIGGASAYIHAALAWSPTAGLMKDWNTPLKNLWAMGNYSKFVRPGWVRVGETDDGGIKLSTYKDPVSGNFALVAINSGSTDITETYTLNGINATSVTPYVTSATDDLAAYPSIAVTGGSISATITASSIVTYYGMSSDAATLQAPVRLYAGTKSGSQTSQIALSWTDNSTSETGYTVERSTNGANWTVLTSSLPANTTTYVDTGPLSEAATYYYRVKATQGATSSAYSAVATGSTMLAAPSGVGSSAVSGGRQLTWTRNSAVNTGVTIQRSTDGLTWTSIASLSASTTSYNDTIPNYNSNEIYWYRVRNTTNSVTSAYAQYNTTVNTPTGFAATLLSPTSVKLTWTNTAVGAYAAYIKQNGSAISPPNLSVAGGTYTVTGLTENTAYTFNVQALGPDAWFRPSLGVTYGAWSGTATTSITTPVAAPTGLSAISTTPGTAVLNWNDNSAIETAYQVEVSTDGSNWTVLTSTLAAGTTTYTDSASPTSGTVYYRVKALTAATSSAYLRTQVTSALPTISGSSAVAGTTVSLTTAAPPGFGSGTLVYTWSLDGTSPGNVIFSTNGSNAASATTATFSSAGSYTFRVTVSDAAGNTTSGTKPVTVSQTVTSVSVLDNSAKASYGGPQEPTPSIAKSTWEQLSATAYDQFGNAFSPSFSWSIVSGGGSVTSSGLYSAPANAATPIVRATSGGISGQITLNVVATPQLVASYGFNETSGYAFANNGLGSADNVAKLSGLNPTLTTGRVGGAISLDGVDDTIWIGRDSDVDIRGQITMSAWIKPDSTGGTQNILTRGYGTWPNFGGTFLRISAGQYQVGYYDGSYHYASSAMPGGDVGQWVHLVGVYDGQTWRLYRDGTQVATYASGHGSTYADRAWRIGSNDNGQSPTDYFNGVVDSVRLYSSALSASDVANLYNQTPYLAMPATATPSVTTGNSTTLSASAIDPDSNSDTGMIYTWSILSKPADAADPTFSVNGNNSARSTVATFTASGFYQFLLTVTNTGSSGWSATSSTSVIVQGSGSQVPTVASAAVASPSSVTGTTTNLSVKGADDGGEANLTYFWTASGPSPVSFLVNGNNAAKNSVAVFSAGGNYTLTAQIIDAGGQWTTSSTSVTVMPSLTTIAVTPNAPTVNPGATQQFSASGLDQFGNVIAASFTWSIVGGVGSINSAGLYTAPASQGGLVAVQATGGSVSGKAVVAVPVDNAAASGVTYTGTWTNSTTVPGYFGSNYQYFNTAGASGTATFATTVPLTGQYNVYAWWTSQGNRNAAVPFDITSASGTSTVTVNQQNNGSTWNLLGTYNFNAGASGIVKIRTPSDVDPNHSVIADAVLLQLVHAAPIVVRPAAASPAPVATTSTTLSVLGTDQTAGESALTYTWTTTGAPPAPVGFSVNGTNAAKNTIANFTAPGTYNFQVTIANPSTGLSTTSSTSVTVNQTLSSIVVSPNSASLNEDGTQQFSATAKDQFGTSLPSQPAFTWSATGGSVDSSGLYTAPFASGSFQVTATSAATNGSAVASVTILPGDVDGDGQRTVADVGSLMTALTDITTYQGSHSLSPNDVLAACNLDGDGAVTNLDLQAMIVPLANAGGASPPASAASATIGLTAPVSVISDGSAEPSDSSETSLIVTKAVDLASNRAVGTPARDNSALPMILLMAPRKTSFEPDHVSVRTAAILSHDCDTVRLTTNVRTEPLDAKGSSVPYLAMHRGHNVSACDEIFSDWPSSRNGGVCVEAEVWLMAM